MIDRKSPPLHSELNTFQLPTAQESTLPNGLALILLGGVQQHIVKIELVYPAAKWNETQSGISYFTAHMLEKGTRSKSSFQIADQLDRLGASLEISPGYDFTTFSLYTLTRNIEEALSLFIEILTEPAFPENELAILKDIYAQNLKINQEKTAFVASKKFRQLLFGQHHPYGNSIEISDLSSLTTERLAAYFHTYFQPAFLFITGNHDEVTIKIITNAFSGLSANKAPVPDSKTNESWQRHTHEFEKQGSVQASLRLGDKTINRHHSDYPALVLLNHILGGYFGSRLMKNIRETKGLTYGIYSSLHPLKNDAYWMIAADVNKDNKQIALTEIKNEIQQLCESIVDESELKIAKSHLLGSLQLEVANPFSVIEKIKVIRLNSLKKSFYDDLFQSVNNTSGTKLRDTAHKYFSHDLLEVVVG
jgi:zinc protease